MSIFSERMDGANFHITRYNKPLNVMGKAQAVRREMNWITLRMGRMAKEHIANNFKAQGFVDETIHRWPKKKRPDGKPILTKTGRLKSSVRIVNRTRNSVSISTPVSYAGVHNRPVGEMKQYATGMYPGRQFMGHSKVLADATHRMIITRLNIALSA